MLVHCDQPDLLLAYIGGAAGRILVHIAMLSPEMHTWDQQVEQYLEQMPVATHATHKLEYIKEKIFPSHLATNISAWKQYEPVPWGAVIEKTKKTIRHCWMMETFAELQRFNCSKIAYVDYSSALPFVIRAGVEKKSHKVIDQPPATQQLIVDQLYKAEQCLARWHDYSRDYNLYALNLRDFFFNGVDKFCQEYYNLCKFYEITPVLHEATALREYWLSLQWKRPNFSCVRG
jgi:hypothetical protein